MLSAQQRLEQPGAVQNERPAEALPKASQFPAVPPQDTPLKASFGVLAQSVKSESVISRGKEEERENKSPKKLAKEIAWYRKKQEKLSEVAAIFENPDRIPKLLNRVDSIPWHHLSGFTHGMILVGILTGIIGWCSLALFVAGPFAGLALMSLYDFFEEKPRFTAAEKTVLRLVKRRHLYWNDYPSQGSLFRGRAERIGERIAKLEEELRGCSEPAS